MSLSRWSRLGQANEVQRRFATFQRRMAPGSLGGRMESASPVSARPAVAVTSTSGAVAPDPPPFSWATVAVSSSGRYYPFVLLHLVLMVASLDVAGTTTTTVVLRKNNVAISGATLSWTSGQTGRKFVAISADLLADTDYLTGAVTAAGTSAKGLVVQPKAG